MNSKVTEHPGGKSFQEEKIVLKEISVLAMAMGLFRIEMAKFQF